MLICCKQIVTKQKEKRFLNFPFHKIVLDSFFLFCACYFLKVILVVKSGNSAFSHVIKKFSHLRDKGDVMLQLVHKINKNLIQNHGNTESTAKSGTSCVVYSEAVRVDSRWIGWEK